MADHDKQTPESFQAGLNAREMAHVYHDTLRDTKFYVEHGTLPRELIIPAWDHLAIGEPQAEPTYEDIASTAPEANNNSPAADPELEGPRSISELEDLRNISEYAKCTADEAD